MPEAANELDGVITARRRRRKPIPSNGKENSPVNASTVPFARRTKRKEIVVLDDTSVDLSESYDSTNRFLHAAKTTSSHSFFNSTLAECIVKSSQSMSVSEGALLLEDNLSEITYICRKLIKEATEEKSSSAMLNQLLVAVHGLRAVSSLLCDISKKEAVLKVLYHAVITLSNSVKENKGTDCNLAAEIGLAAYQALGKVLLVYSVKPSVETDGDTTISFQMQSEARINFFPVPTLRKTKVIGSLTLEQILKIGIQASLEVGSLLSAISCESIKGSSKPMKAPNDFGDYVSVVLQSSHTSPFEYSQYLVNEIVTPWISFSSASDSPEDLFAFSKSSLRLLWDAASRVDKSLLEHKLERSLTLRKYAILGLVLMTEGEYFSNEVRQWMSAKTLDLACVYAWKSAATYAQQSSIRLPANQHDCLFDFYSHVGKALDELQPTCCMAYVEFCAHRCQHIGRNSGPKGTCNIECVFAKLPFRFSHSQCFLTKETKGQESLGVASLAAVFLVRSLSSELKHLSAGEFGTTEFVEFVDAAALSEATNSVMSFVKSSFEKSDADVRLRCYKMFSQLSLSRLAYQISNAATDVQLSLVETEVVLSLGGLLSNCLGPLAEYLTKDSEHNHQGQKLYWDVAIESFTRSASLLDILSLRGDTRERWRQTLSSIHNLALSPLGEPPIDGVEKAAKTLFGIGKRHIDNKRPEEGLLPLMYATEIFSSIVVREKESCTKVVKFQLTHRYISLSSLFEILGRHEETVFALLLALAYDAIEAIADSEGPTNSSHFDAFQYMAASSNDLVFLGAKPQHPCRKLRVSIIKRLVHKLIENPMQQANDVKPINKITLGQVRKTILDSANYGSGVASLGLDSETLARIVFRDFLQCRSPHLTTLLLEEELKISLDLMIQLGHALRDYGLKNVDEPTQNPNLPVIIEFKSSVRQALSISQRYFSTESTSTQRLALGVTYMIGTGALIESGLRCQSTKAVLSRQTTKLLKSAEAAVTQSLELASNESETIFAKAILASAKNAIFELGPDDPNFIDNSFYLCHDATRSLCRTCAGYNPVITAAVVSSLSRTLNQLMYRASLDGQNLRASQLVACNLELSQLTKKYGEEAWYSAVAGEQLLVAGLHATASMILGSCDSLMERLNAERLDRADLASLEKLASQVRAHGASNGDLGPETTITCLQALVGGLQNKVAHWVELTALCSWVASSLRLALAELFERAGELDLALKQLRHCVKLCSHGIHQLKPTAGFRMEFHGLSWIGGVLSPSFALRFIKRQIECLTMSSKIFAFQGDYRQGEIYALSALELSGFNMKCAAGRTSLANVSQHSGTCRTIMHRLCYRNLLNLKSQASAAHLVHEATMQLTLATQINTPVLDDVFALEAALECLFENVDRGDLLFGSMPASKTFVREYNIVVERAPMVSLSPFLATLSSREAQFSKASPQPSIYFVTKLRQIRLLLMEGVDRTLVFDLCHEIAESDFAPPQCRGWAFYYGGILKVEVARASGLLHQLWEGNLAATGDVRKEWFGSVAGDKALAIARSLFKQGLEFAGLSGSTILKRCLLRSLALVSGPPKVETRGNDAAALIHSSIGGMLRRKVSKAIRTLDDDATMSEQARVSEEIFGALDVSFIDPAQWRSATDKLFERAGQLVPLSWRIVSACVCPTGEIILTSLQSSEDGGMELDTVCIFTNDHNVSALPDCTVYDDMVESFDQLVHACEAQLTGMDEEKVNNQYSNESSKREWWKERDDIDRKVRILIEDVDEKYFGCDRVRKLFLGSNYVDKSFDSVECIDMSGGNLASKFEDALSINEKIPLGFGEERSRVEKMTVAELKDELEKRGVEKKAYGKLRKAGLVELLFENVMVSSANTAIDESSSLPNEECRNDCLILILDENLHRFPFEGLSFLKGKAVSRVPSLPFALAPLLDSMCGLVNASTAKYVLDPEGNLPKTSERLLPVVESITTQKRWEWDGIVGTMPDKDFMEAAVSQKNGLLLYCGHGGGQACLSKSKVEKIITKNAGSFDKATLILMGCSSGKLVSVNRKGMQTFEHVPIHYEPEGIALSYLCAGVPCVVGNLWDVTDRDIDKYCTTLLEYFLGGDGERSMAQCVADARGSCKMKHLVGLAPVCYGIPVHLARP
jgi:hypothetical protein